MPDEPRPARAESMPEDRPAPAQPAATPRPLGPLPNYSLSTECPACGAPTVRRACKVRCDRCGFMWDCSEL
jgi:hypothetical protein